MVTTLLSPPPYYEPARSCARHALASSPAGRYLLRFTQSRYSGPQGLSATPGVCPSGQRRRAVNPLAYAYGGSNPPAPNSPPRDELCQCASLPVARHAPYRRTIPSLPHPWFGEQPPRSVLCPLRRPPLSLDGLRRQAEEGRDNSQDNQEAVQYTGGTHGSLLVRNRRRSAQQHATSRAHLSVCRTALLASRRTAPTRRPARFPHSGQHYSRPQPVRQGPGRALGRRSAPSVGYEPQRGTSRLLFAAR